MKKQFRCLSLSFLLLAPACLWAQAAPDYRDMGQALLQKGLYAKAVQYFQQAVAADPNDWQSYQGMGDAYMKMNENSEALDSYQRSLQVNPNNPTVRARITSLGGSSAASSGTGEFEQSQPTTVYQQQPPAVPQRSYVRPRPRQATYADGLAPMDHAKFWAGLQLGYDYSTLGEFTDSANSLNNGTFVNPATQVGNYAYSANALAPNGGLNLGLELGFQLDVHSALALGIKYTQTNDYTASIGYNSPGADYEDSTLTSYLVPLTLDYYLFLPDGGGRFFLSGGVGYYLGDIHVNEGLTTFNYLGNGPQPTNPDTWTGDLTSGNIGFQVGLGREFAVTRNSSIEIFGRAHFVQITNFRGVLSDPNGYQMQALLATGTSSTNKVVDVDQPQYVNGAYQEKATTMDYTGFDVGVAFNFYSF